MAPTRTVRPLTSSQAVSGDVGDIGQQTSIALDDIDQVAAHLCTGERFPVYLKTGDLERDRWDQRRLNAMNQRKLGLHADSNQTLGAGE